MHPSLELPAARRRTLAIAAVIAFALVIAAIAYRNAGLYPIVFSDEYTYSMDSRLKPFSDAAIPSYLFFAVYRSTLLCGDGFLACARWLNLLWLAAATPFVWLVARRVTTPAVATWIALVALASPFNTYTAVFIPESMYYCGFWVVVWFATRFTSATGVRYWTGLGLLVGLLTLLKPHALFLIPALMIHGAIATMADRGIGTKALVGCLALFVGVLLVTKLGAGYLFAGSRGITLFGSYYGSATAPLEIDSGAHWRLAMVTAFVLKGHLMALALLFSMPAVMLVSALVATRRSTVHDPQWRFCVLTALLLGSLVVMAAVYTATVAGVAPSETEQRVHMRYYDFAFPLLLIVGATIFGESLMPRRPTRIAAALLAIVVLYVGTKGFRDYEPGLIDSPELYGVGIHAATRRLTGLFALVGLGVLFWKPRLAPLYFAFVLMPWVEWKGAQGSFDLIGDRSRADVYDEAGLYAHRRSTREEADRTRVVGDDAAGVFRALFHLDDAGAIPVFSTPGQPITSELLAAPHDRALVIGDHPVVGSDLRSTSSGDATLVWKATPPAPESPR